MPLIMVVDDHPMARQGVVAMLRAFDGQFEVVAEAGTIDEALARADTARPEIVLTDLHFDSEKTRNGLDLIALIHKQQADIQFVMITSEVHDQFLLKAHDAGANAYLYKHASAAELVRAIESVANGFTHFPVNLQGALDRRNREPALTPRESELLPYIARGMTAKEIARELSHTAPQCPIIDCTV